MSELYKLILIRHSRDDQSYIDGNNDTSLTNEGIDLAQQMSQKIVQLFMNQRDYGRVNVYSNDRKRTFETAKILCETLKVQNIPHVLCIDEYMRELRQGKIINVNILSHKEKVSGLEKAWSRFDAERFRGNIYYRFGEPPLSYGDVKVRDFIEGPYGECQNELSYRVNKSLKDIITNMKKYPNDLFVIITHRGIIREIMNILHSVNEQKNFFQHPMFEMSGWEYCGIIDINIKDINYTISEITGNLKSLEEVLDNGI